MVNETRDQLRFLVTIEANEQEFDEICQKYLIREVTKLRGGKRSNGGKLYS